MKNRFLFILLLFLIFLFYVFLVTWEKQPKKHKILKVVEADEFYIDLNDNNFIDEDEHFKLKDIISFKPHKNKKVELISQSLGLDVNEYLKAGFCARNWAIANLSNKEVYISSKLPVYNKDIPIRYIKVKFNNKDLGEFLLSSGLAYLNRDCIDAEYLQLQNIKQIKLNAKEISKVVFYIVNLKNDMVHKLDCEYARLISNAKLVAKKSLNNYKYCSICFSRNNINFKISKSDLKYQKSISKKFNNIELFLLNPLEHKKPNKSCSNDFCKTLVKEINSSQKSIDIALYGMGDQKEVYDALLKAKNRNVKIRAVVDDKKVLTGSANISPTDSGGYSANIAVLINSSQLAMTYKDEFNKMYNSKFSTLKTKTNNSKIILDDSVLRVYFSPQDNVLENLLLPEIKNAKSEIFVSIFYLTDKKLINELINAKKRNVNVMVLLDSVAASNFKDRVYLLRNNSIPVVVENWGGKNHEKTIMIDSKILILGSCNFSRNAFKKNDENVIKIVNTDIASFYRDYYLYLFNSIDRKYLHYIPRAEGIESKNSCYDGIDNNFDGKIDLEDDGCKNLK